MHSYLQHRYHIRVRPKGPCMGVGVGWTQGSMHGVGVGLEVKVWGLFSSPEPSGSQGELIVYPCSVVRPSVVRPSSVRRPPFSKIFFSETAWPIKAKFYMKHLWEGGTNVYINNPGHMTKMAAMPIYGKNPSKIFFSGTTGPISTKLGMKHR